MSFIHLATLVVARHLLSNLSYLNIHQAAFFSSCYSQCVSTYESFSMRPCGKPDYELRHWTRCSKANARISGHMTYATRLRPSNSRVEMTQTPFYLPITH